MRYKILYQLFSPWSTYFYKNAQRIRVDNLLKFTEIYWIIFISFRIVGTTASGNPLPLSRNLKYKTNSIKTHDVKEEHMLISLYPCVENMEHEKQAFKVSLSLVIQCTK